MCRTCSDRKYVPIVGGTMECPDCVSNPPPQSGGGGGGTASGGCISGCIGWVLGHIFFAVILLLLWGAVLVGVGVYQNMNSAPGVLAEGESQTTWSGSYLCSDGERGLQIDLNIRDGNPDGRRVNAELTVLSSPPGPEAQELSSVVAQGVMRGRELALTVDAPASAAPFEIQSLESVINEEATGMFGTVMSPGCQSFAIVLQD